MARHALIQTKLGRRAEPTMPAMTLSAGLLHAATDMWTRVKTASVQTDRQTARFAPTARSMLAKIAPQTVGEDAIRTGCAWHTEQFAHLLAESKVFGGKISLAKMHLPNVRVAVLAIKMRAYTLSKLQPATTRAKQLVGTQTVRNETIRIGPDGQMAARVIGLTSVQTAKM